MTIATYNDLVAAVTNWMGRDDLVARVPEFIALAEAKLNRLVKSSLMETRAYATVNAADTEPQFITLPWDFLTMRSVCLSNFAEKPRLQYLADTQIKDLRSNIGDASGVPQFFGVFGTEMELVPKPSSNYVLEMIYRSSLAGITLVNPANWLLINAPDAYLYGVLLEASFYMKEDNRIPVWVEGFKSAIDSLNGLTPEVVPRDAISPAVVPKDI